jgi:hypothetical protein
MRQRLGVAEGLNSLSAPTPAARSACACLLFRFARFADFPNRTIKIVSFHLPGGHGLFAI